MDNREPNQTCEVSELGGKCRWVQVAVASIAMLWVGFLSRAELA